MHPTTPHQLEQMKIVDSIENNILNNTANIELLNAPKNFDSDPRTCLGLFHLPKPTLKNTLYKKIIVPIKKQFPEHYYTKKNSLHMTIKNIRTASDPPTFSQKDIQTAEKVFSQITKTHKTFNVYFYKLLLFPMSLSLVGLTDPEFDKIVLDSDKILNDHNLSDNKKYANSKYFFINVTLARFENKFFNSLLDPVKQISNSLNFEPYTVDSASLVTTNASFHTKTIIKSWKLQM